MPFDPSARRSGSVFSSDASTQGAWIVYINGIEVPSIGFELEYGVWEIPSFRVHLVPDILIQRLGNEDRVPVQIFYLDSWASDQPKFRLLCDGEIIGWSFSNASGTRSIAFSCIGHIHLFKQLYFFYMTNVDDIVASRSPEMLTQGFATPGLIYPYALFHQGLLSNVAQVIEATPQPGDAPSATALDSAEATTEATAVIKAPYELVTNVLKGIISSEVPENRRSIPMLNFFSRHVRKTRFHNRWVRLPLLEDAETLANRVGVFPIFEAARNEQALIAMQRQISSQVGSSGPVWSLLEQVLNLVYMEIAMIPNPSAVQVQLQPLSPGNPQEGKIVGPFTDDVHTFAVREGVDRELARGQAEEYARRLRAMITGEEPLDQELVLLAGFRVLPRTIQEINAVSIAEKLIRLQQIAANQAGDEERREVNPTQPIRLAQHFVKPNFYFGEIPSCNVIYPSMIVSWTFDESYINQPTRVYVNDSVMTRLLRASGANRELMLHALTVGFPEEADAVIHHKVASSALSEEDAAAAGGESGKNLLIWPEEYYKGPVTERFDIPSWFQFLRQFANRAQGNPEEEPGTPPPVPPPNPMQPRQASIGPNTSIPRSTLSTPVQLVAPQAFTPVDAAAAADQARRGRIFTRPEADPNWTYRWRLNEEQLRIANSVNAQFDSPYTIRQAGEPERFPVPEGTRRLVAHLRQIFSGISSVGIIAGRGPAVGERRTNPHTTGRAFDLMIPRLRRSLPNLEVGNVIADYLIRNAEAFGVQYIIWSRSEWQSQRRGSPARNPRFQHYTRSANDPDPNEAKRYDHTDHLHVELNVAGATAITPFFTRGASATAVPPRAVITTVSPTPRVATGEASTAQPGQTNRTAAPSTTSGENQTTEAPEGVSAAGDPFSDLFRIYAQEEYLKKRYEKRNAAASLRFNPYLVPGFPMMLLDSMRTRMHMVGWVRHISHTGFASTGSASMSTSVSFSYCRTIHEFINDVRNDAIRFRGKVTSAPAEIIRELRVVIQDENFAEEFYRKLLFGAINQATDPRPKVFPWYRALGYATGARVETIEIAGMSVSEVEAEEQAIENRLAEVRQNGEEVPPRPPPSQRTVTTNLDPNLELAPNPEYEYADAFDSREVAMRLASRPVCTLEQYIRFWHGGRSINELLNAGEIEDPRDDFTYSVIKVEDTVNTNNDGTQVRGQTERKTAEFYGRIFRLRTGPGARPTDEERGYTPPPNIQPTVVSAGVAYNYPQTRADWTTALIEYRNKVRFKVSPGT